MDYPVPDLGQDHDVKETMKNERIASKMVGHNWNFGSDESKARWHNKAKDTDYDFAPKLDGDMIDTNAHKTAAELRYGGWDLAQRNSFMQ